MVVPWPIIAYDRAVVKNCFWPCQGHVLRDSNHSIYYCMICTGYSLLALSFMLEPFIQFGEYIVMKYRGKPQIDMWFSWCFALALDVWKTRACEITTLLKSENAAEFSLQKDQNMKQAGWQEPDNYMTCKQAILTIMLIAGRGRQRLEIFS